MKKIILFLSIIMLLIPINIYASESNQSTTEVIEAPWEYGEMKNGLFVRDIAEEVSWAKNYDIEFYLDEISKATDARRIGYLTPEMEAAGWILVYGTPTSPKDAKGDPSPEQANKDKAQEELENMKNEVIGYDENGNPIVKIGYGYVTFSAFVESVIHETCFVEVTNVNSNAVFSFELFEQNGFSRSVQLPTGSYIITNGGIYKDYASNFPISTETFTVNEGEAVIVSFTIGEVSETTEITVNVTEDSTEVENIDQIENTNNSSGQSFTTWLVIIICIILILILVFLGFCAYTLFLKK